MKQKFISHTQSPSLILFFAGWGMDYNIFNDISFPNYDICVCYDYNSLDIDTSLFKDYQDIYLFAWSFGVAIANHVIAQNDIDISKKIAINGTLFPIDDQKGIPENIFWGTLNSLNETNLEKFIRRICGSRKEYNAFANHKSKRNFENIQSELVNYSIIYKTFSDTPISWDKAIVSDKDQIFPIENQLSAWNGICKIERISAPHLPDFSTIINNNIINTNLLKYRFTKAQKSYDSAAIPQLQIAENLNMLWEKYSNSTNIDILEIGCGTGVFTKLYYNHRKPSQLYLNDICDISSPYPHTRIIGNAESIEFNHQFDAIVSSSAIQWFNNPARFFSSVHNFLSANGILAISTFGINNLHEIKDITNVGLDYMQLHDIIDILQQHFDILYSAEDENIYNFSSSYEVLQHLKLTGVNNISSRKWTKGKLNTFIQEYDSKFKTDDGGVTLTYNPIYIIAKKKNHEE